MAVLGVLALGLAGCGSDNETAAEQLQKGSGSAPKLPEGADKPVPQKQMGSMEDYAKQRTDAYSNSGYPGSKKKK